MIEFTCNWRHRDGTPIVKDAAIEYYAEQVLADFQPQLLKEPGRIDELRFIEDYLGAAIFYPMIVGESSEYYLAGATLFNGARIMVYDEDDERIVPVDFSPNTILINKPTLDNEGFSLFTHLHETGHYCMHRRVYQKSLYEQSLELFSDQIAAREGVFCRANDMLHLDRRLITQEDFREHQANVFAASLAMPRKMFQETVREYVRKEGMGDGPDDVVVLHGWRAYGGYNYPLEKMLKTIAGIFGVSKTAVRIQMKSRGLLMSDREYEKKYGKIQVVV